MLFIVGGFFIASVNAFDVIIDEFSWRRVLFFYFGQLCQNWEEFLRGHEND